MGVGIIVVGYVNPTKLEPSCSQSFDNNRTRNSNLVRLHNSTLELCKTHSSIIPVPIIWVIMESTSESKKEDSISGTDEWSILPDAGARIRIIKLEKGDLEIKSFDSGLC